MNGYGSREELIRDHWKRYGFHWDLKKMPRLKLPVRHRLEPYFPAESGGSGGDTPPIHDALEFSLDRGTINDQPAYLVLCEGIVVEEGTL